ncbi:unnamed protein product [Cyprideis torosa]|uniref:Uncharacterized protein n=1 Tax=Cyprideis torosa TaxID=163714 RepID=A0A7R8W9P0_9CRUS|nr:unnamed protein product [Cyprideis torosa]CAG0884507.1 unnamed protein product [Cyprideis torosa]
MASNEIVEKKIMCPFNEAHMIYNDRYLRHLSRCSKTYMQQRTGREHMEFLKCPFDQTHVLPAGEIEHHIRNVCESSVCFTRSYSMAEGNENIYEIFSKVEKANYEESDDWDREGQQMGVKPYDPQEAIRDRPILRRTIAPHHGKAARKKTREQNRAQTEQARENNQKGLGAINEEESLAVPARPLMPETKKMATDRMSRSFTVPEAAKTNLQISTGRGMISPSLRPPPGFDTEPGPSSSAAAGHMGRGHGAAIVGTEAASAPSPSSFPGAAWSVAAESPSSAAFTPSLGRGFALGRGLPPPAPRRISNIQSRGPGVNPMPRVFQESDAAGRRVETAGAHPSESPLPVALGRGSLSALMMQKLEM